ncbi:MAG: bifunctional [glutamine synthetase] adenylyltransferase/[glutamine synthetase]-adenylyl-L-tyrosine phosphorylase, partial [Pseudomonadota bacterium]
MSPLGATLVPLPGPVDAAFLAEFQDALGTSDAASVSGELVAALASVAAVSPFLRGLMLADPQMAVAVLNASLNETVVAACDFSGDLGTALRVGKRRVALAVALADLCGGASVEAVTGALSTFADAAVEAALASVLAGAHRRGHAASADPSVSGVIVLAMGKLGGGELNYSSDIDLVVLFDPQRAQAAGLSSGRVVRLTQAFARLLDKRTEDGYVFRVDLRLRPDPASTAAAVSTTSAIAYYQSRARAWERQAMIKARQVAGDRTAGARYLRTLEPSIWHGAYDFGAIDETLAMREQIAAVKGAGDITAPGHNIKVGRGGIREIEFIVQSLQKLAGGRDLRLRGKSTLPMLDALARGQFLSPQDAETLGNAYRFLRRLEHRLQMISDEQLHTLPDAGGMDRIARMMGDEAFEETLRATLNAVNERFLSLGNGGVRANPMLAGLTAEATLPEELGASFAQKFEIWQAGRY